MMLYRIKASYRRYFRYPATSMDYIDHIRRWQSSVESSLSNSVASFRKWVIEDLGIKESSGEYASPEDLERYNIEIKFSRKPHPIYDPYNFVHDNREFLSDDELLQYDELIYIDYVRSITN